MRRLESCTHLSFSSCCFCCLLFVVVVVVFVVVLVFVVVRVGVGVGVVVVVVVVVVVWGGSRATMRARSYVYRHLLIMADPTFGNTIARN